MKTGNSTKIVLSQQTASINTGNQFSDLQGMARDGNDTFQRYYRYRYRKSIGDNVNIDTCNAIFLTLLTGMQKQLSCRVNEYNSVYNTSFFNNSIKKIQAVANPGQGMHSSQNNFPVAFVNNLHEGLH
jgi:hypothetical protein